MSTTPNLEPTTYDCRRNRHLVITADRSCIKCGARGVTDARRLPPLTHHDTTDHPTPPPLAGLEPPRSPHDPIES